MKQEKIDYSDHFEEFKPFDEKERTYEPAPKEPLEQIADNLGRIADSLETLTECIDTNYTHSWLNIAGTITNYE